jgi:hypothetical protein
VVIVQVEVDGPLVELLTRLGWLPEADVHDRAEIGAAIAALLRDAAG